MQDFEKLGAFYLGKTYDLATKKTRDDLVLYDSKDLTTHAVCVGMTGSGKTGLCLALLEEAAIDGIPAIAIDPKGDLGNLFLTFPDLKPEDFQPWIDPKDAERAGKTAEEFAAETATRWRDGLAEWGQDPARIAKFRNSVDMAIYTPGSNAGLPLTVLRSFDAPAQSLIDDADAFRERITSATSGLLALLGIEADPVRSREHILISKLLETAWRAGKNLDVAALIREIQSPPFDKVGAFDVETFFPSADRVKLSMSLNNLLASPSFAGWMAGEPLDIKKLLYTAEGKPRLSIISIAHLSEPERMFFVTILLNEVLAWVRSQPGTSSLRALLYMDEVFGYFPPTANPPTKTPMLTLLKQARAFGVGVVLATQNPVDLDYKGLSNTGTWFLGRLQTERDKARVLEGLEGASAQAGSTFDRQQMEKILAALGNRVFLMNNVHEDEPVVFQSRWALSYLRGPLTRGQIEQVMKDRKATQKEATAAPTATEATAPAAATATVSSAAGRPALPAGVDEKFLAATAAASKGNRLVYRPALLGSCKLHFVQATTKTDAWVSRVLFSSAVDESGDIDWSESSTVDADSLDVESEPDSEIEFSEVPASFAQAKSLAAWQKSLKDHAYQNEVLSLFKCADLKASSNPGESEGDFRGRLSHEARERRDEQVEKLRSQYASKVATLQSRIRTAEDRVAREKSQSTRATFDSMISIGSSIMGALFGRKLASRTNIGKATTSMRSLGRAAEQRGDVGRAEENVQALQQQVADLEAQLQSEIDQIDKVSQPDSLLLEEAQIRPRKSDIQIESVGVIWTPWIVDSKGIAEPAFEVQSV